MVLISGGGTGVGAATALTLAKRGYSVAINYRHSAEAAEEVAKLCRAEGVDSITVQGDVAIDEDCKALVLAVNEKWGRLNALVCSAGQTQFTRLTDLDAQNADDFQKVYAANVLGVYQLVRASAPMLKASGSGSVVSVSSIAGLNGNGSSLAYIASKGALNTLTLALARLLAPEIRVNAVLPGLIDSGWFLNGMDDEKYGAIRDGFADASALGEVCSPQDVANVVAFLTADATKMTGQLVTVDGGYMIGKAVKLSK